MTETEYRLVLFGALEVEPTDSVTTKWLEYVVVDSGGTLPLVRVIADAADEHDG